MRVIVEWDGVLADVRAAYWHAYSQAVTAIGFARTDEATFWRLTRKGANAGELVQGAKPRHTEVYQQHFATTLESDETVSRIAPYEGATEQIRKLCNRVAIVTTGINIAARRRITTQTSSSTTERYAGSYELVHLAQPLIATLHACATEFGPGSPIVVLTATEALTRAADEAELPPIGIASGACSANRLAIRGARVTFPTLDAFLQAWQSADSQLTALGINPPPTQTAQSSNERNPRLPHNRDAAREARRQARMSRRKRE